MKIALIHDWLRVNAGSEKVIKEIVQAFQDQHVDVYTLFNTLNYPDKKDILADQHVHVTLLQYFPYVDRLYRYLLPLLPFFIRTIRPEKADIYLSSSHAVAKGFTYPKEQLHVCYCHTPMRYAWYLYEDYWQDTRLLGKWVLRLTIPFIKKWDLRTSSRVNYFIANSVHIQKQIKAIYDRDAEVIYPPVNVNKFKLNANPRQDFYLAVGRFVSHKKIDIIIEAFKEMKDHKLVLIGNGYDAKSIKALIGHATNIVWLGYQHDDELILYMQNAKATIFAAKEDFGIMCVEAQSTGTPVLALNYGGYCESVADGITGYFFNEQNSESIQLAVKKFEQHPLTNFAEIRKHALRFSDERFRNEIRQFVLTKSESFQRGQNNKS